MRKKRENEGGRTVGMAWIVATGNLPEPDLLEVSAAEDEGGRLGAGVSNPGLGASVAEESKERADGEQGDDSQQRRPSPLDKHCTQHAATQSSGGAFLFLTYN